MKPRTFCVLSTVGLAVLTLSSVQARASSPSSPRLLAALDGTFPGPDARGGPAGAARATVWIAVLRPPSTDDLQVIEETGATLCRVDGEPLVYRRLIVADVDRASFPRLLALPFVADVVLAPAAALRPLARSAALLGIDRARGARADAFELTGAGVRVVDLDTNANVFHPALFRGDAGYFDWLDVDGDDRFDPDVDAIDLDRDGLPSANERSSSLRNETLDGRGAVFVGRGAAFDPGLDWVYLDQDGNGQRDFGPDAGFDEDVPAFGEPTFTPDDVNRNGVLDRGERLVRLGTSKIYEVYVSVDWPGRPKVDHVFRRGTDLSKKRHDYAAGIYGYPETLHATAVLGILAGDLALVGRRNVGVAPDADLLLGFEVSAHAAKALPWALSRKPHAVLHEGAAWTAEVLDGSDPTSLLIDESMEQEGIVHVCPTGNLGGSGKHAHAELLANEARQLVFRVPSADYRSLRLTLNDRSGAGSGAVLVTPAGERFDIGAAPSVAGGRLLEGGGKLYVVRDQSSRGTHLVDAHALSAAPLVVAVGAYTLELRGGKAGGTVDAYLSDDVSGWGVGIAWDGAVASDDRTIGVPAVANGCVAVGAVPDHLAGEGPVFAAFGQEGPGERRWYSSTGPRIDGALGVAVLAPDNVFTAAGEADPFFRPLRLGQSALFNGTSSAAPQVTALAALLAQIGVHGASAGAAIRGGARATDSGGSLPNAAYGYGLADAAGALGVGQGGIAPRLALGVSRSTVAPGESVLFTPIVTDADAGDRPAMLRWDDGYDGVWDGAYAPVGPRTVSFPGGGTFGFKARVRDADGLVGEAVATIFVSGPPAPVLPPAPPIVPRPSLTIDAPGGASRVEVTAASTGACDVSPARLAGPRWFAPWLLLGLLGCYFRRAAR